MKIIFFLLISIFLIQGKSYKSSGQVFTTDKVDTLEISNIEFRGKCQGNCFKFIGYELINKINQNPLQNNQHPALFIKCPSPIRLTKLKTYKFTAKKFKPDSCTTIIDTTNETSFYYLLKEIK